MAARKGSLPSGSSGEKSRKKKLERVEKQDEAENPENREKKCAEKVAEGSETQIAAASVEDSSRGSEDEWYDEESQESLGAFIRPGNRRFRRTGEAREKLARIKVRAMERVMDELEVDADVKKMVVLKTELMERGIKVYGEKLRRADVADPNRARYVRDRMSVSVEEALEEKGWRVLETSRSPLSQR